MSRAMKPGIGLETEFAFFFPLNCPDASPLGVSCRPGIVNFHLSMGLGTQIEL